jgi:hypothetical protein
MKMYSHETNRHPAGGRGSDNRNHAWKLSVVGCRMVLLDFLYLPKLVAKSLDFKGKITKKDRKSSRFVI